MSLWYGVFSMAVEANFSENKLSQQYSADRYLIHAHFEIEKKQLLVGIFSIWKQLWIELEKTLLVIYNTLENPSALLDIILYAWLSSSYECNGIRPCILHPFLNLFFYLSYLGGQQWNSTLCVWCTHLDILQSLNEIYLPAV